MRLVDYISEHYAPGSGHASAINALAGRQSAMPYISMFLFGEKHKIIGRVGSGIHLEVASAEDMLAILRTEMVAQLQVHPRERMGLGFCGVDQYGNPLPVSQRGMLEWRSRNPDHSADALSYAMFSGRVIPNDPRKVPQRIALCVVGMVPGADPYRIEELDSLIADIHKQVTLYSLTGSWNTMASQPGNL